MTTEQKTNVKHFGRQGRPRSKAVSETSSNQSTGETKTNSSTSTSADTTTKNGNYGFKFGTAFVISMQESNSAYQLMQNKPTEESVMIYLEQLRWSRDLTCQKNISSQGIQVKI